MGLFIGIDLGTTGIRGIVVDAESQVLVSRERSIPMASLYEGVGHLMAGWNEQNPLSWEENTHQLLTEIIRELKNSGFNPEEIKAICSDSTSGTVLAVDQSGKVLTSAIMYNDIRAQEEAEIIQKSAENYSKKVGYKFKASFSLPKIFWMKRHLPEIFAKTYKFLHANDFLIGLLTGEYCHSDASNCLKAGYNFIDGKWPSFIDEDLGISSEKLPEVVLPGEKVGRTSEKLDQITGFPSGTLVLGGATDSTMALVASGASVAGDVFSSLGTTLVTRVLTRELIRDPQGRVYCHVLPGKDRIYLPGGASSVGAECLKAYFREINYKEYDQKALEYFPSKVITYPLVKRGERFPFVDPTAEHFYQGRAENKHEKYTAYLQAVAFVERLSIEVLESLGAEIGERVFTIGGATRSNPWLQIRADVLQKSIFRPKIIEAAYGAAIVAASTVIYNENLTAAIKQFVQPDIIIEPRRKMSEKLDKRYHEFLSEIKKRFKIE